MREVTLRVRHHGEPESDVSARYPDVTLRSVSSLTGRGAERKRIIEVTGNPESVAGFIEEFRATDPIQAADPLSPLGERRVYVAMVYDVRQWDSISERLSDRGVHYRTGTTITAGWERWTVYLEDDDDLAGLIASLRDAGNDVELVKNVEMSQLTVPDQLDVEQVLSGLTHRQREALAAAIDTGYFGHEGEGSIKAVAERLDVAPSTAWEHLSRAEAKVMGKVGDYLAESRSE